MLVTCSVIFKEITFPLRVSVFYSRKCYSDAEIQGSGRVLEGKRGTEGGKEKGEEAEQREGQVREAKGGE